MRPAFTVLVDVLAQVSGVLRQLTDAEYRAPGPEGVSGSVSQHVRHCLDHVHALEDALRSRQIDYDARDRGGAIEHDRRLAIQTLDHTCARLLEIDDRWLAGLVEVRSQLSADGRRLRVNSTIGRELAFVISHTIHHNATINVLLHQRDRFAPAGFGYAASTPCARSA